MKKTGALSFVLFILLGNINAQNWYDLSIPAGIYPNALDFIHPNEGWVIDNYAVIHTIDGGESWEFQEVPTEALMNSVSFVNETDGWIAADNGVILQTNDVGLNWNEQASGTPYALKKILFNDALHGWAIGFGPGFVGTFLYTIDGGQNWMSTDCPCLFNDLDFHNATQGWMVCDDGKVYSTYDGGITIEPLNLSNSTTLTNVDFVNEGVGWVVGENNLLQQTLNGGLDWYDETSPLQAFALSGLSFASMSVGAISASSSIAVTLDGGDSWEVAQIPNAFIRDIEMLNEYSGYATTVNGVIKYCGLGILTQPESVNVAEGSPVQLNTQATIFGASYQWQALINGSWENLEDNGAYTGTNNNSLFIAAAYSSMIFRCVITFEACSITTNEVAVQTTVGVGEFDSNSIIIYPNPASTFITLEIPNEFVGETMVIYDVIGREIYRSQPANTTNNINVAPFSSGSYMLRVGNQNVRFQR
jgi:photosystem II stability/assembly factor-like uncharacterized protein